MLAIVSLVDIDGDIPSKPPTSGPGMAGVIATWRAVSEYVQALSDLCLVRQSELGWMGYGKQAMSAFYDSGFRAVLCRLLIEGSCIAPRRG